MRWGNSPGPGPGFLPIVLGVAGVVVATLLLAGSFQKRKRAMEKEDLPSQDKEARKGLIRIFGYIAAPAVLIALYEALGSLGCK